MREAVDLPLLGGVRFIVTNEMPIYLRLARAGARVFLAVELDSIMYQRPTKQDMEWILIQKKLKPGAWIMDVKKREVGFPEELVPA